MNQIEEIKRLLTLSEIAQSKVEFNFNGTKVTNPMQQADSNRLYNRAWKMRGELTSQEFIKIHTEVTKNFRNYEKVN